jgi:hypothetical protein
VFANALNWLSSQSLCKRLQGGDFCNLTEISSVDLIDSVSQVSFKGLTGDISFNNTNPDRRRSYFDIFQYNITGQINQVGKWNITGSFLSRSELGWKILPKSQGGNGNPKSSSSGQRLSGQAASPAGAGGSSSSFVPLSSNSSLMNSHCTR